MIEHNKLFSRTSTGATRYWFIQQDNEKYRSVSGQLDTNSPIYSGWQVAEPKNIGKINQTSDIVQAGLEIESEYKKKQSLGYHLDINNIDDNLFFEPMLAKSFDIKRINFKKKIYISPKLDGVRCIATIHGLFSRTGKRFESVPHIFEAIKHRFEQDPDLVLDGELYNHTFKNDFNEIISLVRKTVPTKEDLRLSSELIQYHIYDIYSDKGFEHRIEKLSNLLSEMNNSNLVLVDAKHVTSESEIETYYAKYVEDGYEGAMIRLSGIEYENKRTFQLMKLKSFIDQEFVIEEIKEGAGNRAGMAGKVVCRLPDGRLFGSGIKGTNEYSKQLLLNKDKYVNGTATVKYFNLTPDGVPRFPVCTAVYIGQRDM